MAAVLEEPDKGYAWVVLFGGCLINAILSGMARTIGLLYVSLIEEYGITRQQASLPFLIRNAVKYLAGPLVSVLGQSYGIRSVTFWGGVVAAAGSILCAFAPSIGWIIFLWGIVHGLGFSLACTLFQVVVNQYFDRHRTTASGIVLSGACVSALIFPYMMDSMIVEYGLSGSFLLLGGLFLHILPPALVLKEPSWIQFPEAYARKRAQLLNLKRPEMSGKSDLNHTLSWLSAAKLNEQTKVGISITGKFNGYNIRTASEKSQRRSVICTVYRPLDIDGVSKQEDTTSYQTGFYKTTQIPKPGKSFAGAVDGNLASKPVPARKSESSFFQNIRKIPGLYRSRNYFLISLSMAAYFGSLLPLVAVIVDYGRDKGLPSAGEKFLIYSLTLGDLLGRLGFGWVADRKYLSFPHFMMLAFTMKGAFLILLTMSDSMVALIVVLALYGCVAGIIIVCLPVLVHVYVDQEYHTLGIGCIGLVSSATTLGIPLLIGKFRDRVGSYDGLFYVSAAVSVFMGFLWLLASLKEKALEKKTTKTGQK